MKRELRIDGLEHRIELRSSAPDCRFSFDGAGEQEAQVEMPQPGVYSILIGGRSYDAFVEEDAAGTVVSIDGHRFAIEIRDPRRWSKNAAGQTRPGVQTIASPMPGKVVRVLVAAGDTVEPGQGIVVVEAMKMQNEMKAARAGRVLALAAKEGATVAAGEILATIE